MRRSYAFFTPVLALMLLNSCAVEQPKLSYATSVPRAAVKDGICEYRVEGNLCDFIRPYLTVEIRRHGPSPQPSLSGWVSLLRPDGEEAVKAPVQMLLISSSAEKGHPEQMRDRYGTRLELGLANHPKTIWDNGGTRDAAQPLSASIFLHTPADLQDEMGEVALNGRMYRSDVRHWKIAREEHENAFMKKGRLAYDPEVKRAEPEKKG